ncbi:MAG: hypothetical protein LBH90_08565, partial [Tannerella sp.]|nr:hypothetical protein [Tannerella sp.]
MKRWNEQLNVFSRQGLSRKIRTGKTIQEFVLISRIMDFHSCETVQNMYGEDIDLSIRIGKAGFTTKLYREAF